eukprot:TRINITY_DN1336_c0_g1_i1.p1 TRINITY_DN1336_c0_g1~~TRINITY_DN1336_c0_g1_i1.p1  ORF type:complete len:778 (+),score=226.61 TRINITY_DN1336_c0_g1_i1:117-2450(+)
MDKLVVFLTFLVLIFIPAISYVCHAEATTSLDTELEPDLKQEKVALKTDDDVVNREEQQISSDGFSVAEKKLLEQNAQQYQFQAEINRLMGIIVNSLYSSREIFLREVVSNASDALDKIRYQSLTDKSVLGDTPHLEIRIKIDKENRLLHIRDTGVGMTREELINNLGKIAQSGTRDWIDKVSNSGDIDSQIGQFGVGFYSTFLVADTVTVTSKHNDDPKQHVWVSSSSNPNNYSITEDPRGNTLGRGTLISLEIREDALEFLEEAKIKELVQHYSAYINFPIHLWSSKEVEKEVLVEDTEEDVTEEEAETEESEVEVEVDEEKPKTKTIKETVWDWVLLNDIKPLWTRKPADITQEEYESFYTAITKDNKPPTTYMHFLAEGDVEFTGLLYVPSEPPYNIFEGEATKSDIKLYVRRVFITNQFRDILPSYLSFVKGLIDSNDLPLNVSREMLQQHKTLNVIKKKIIRKAIAMFQELAEAEDQTKFEQFYKNFSTNLKLGIIEDSNNRTRLSKLLRFNSLKHQDKPITFTQYVEEMKENQEGIYFLGGETKEMVLNSPFIEKLKKNGFDVLFMTEPIDEYTMQVLDKFDGKHKFINVSKENVKIDDEDDIKKSEEEFKPLVEYLKKTLTGKVSKVKVTNRLTKTPCALVSSDWGMSPNMERIFKAQALSDQRARTTYGYATGQKVLEINPKHPIVKELLKKVLEDDEDPTTEDIATVLYDAAILNSGYALDEPTGFADRIHKMLAKNLDLDLDFEESLESDVKETQNFGDETDKDEL